ncbi:hypothetical protein SAMN05216559_3062 [Halomicrobium zhouii]|uniref:Uncharacterized protein n=1 Tax=Halomicrobium zhouii TaxID=767519 RepID=A0A1I6LT35_9EURY|nr:hypothetical protein [Halomicrobium zhouii]SFS06584.1 hypothetical protein SAMN05216559_3062 [Halomicrobium zhouii]
MDEQQIAETEAVADEVESETDDASRAEDEHLAGVEDGCGCTEVWEHLSENRVDE